MQVAIPPEFEQFANDQVKAGVVASEEEAASLVLREYASRIGALRATIDEGKADIAARRSVDGRAVMAELIERTRAQCGE